VVRLALLMTHYREPLDFTVARLEEAEQKLRDWQRAARAATKGAIAPPERTVIAELMDDLNFHRASVALDAVARKANRGVQSASDCMGATLEFLGFGLDTLLQPDSMSDEVAIGIEERVNRRLEALNARDFPAADRIRAELALEGIQLMDYRDDAGDRQTRWEVKG
jgi:cysteinyl-tRNA synthetase